MNSATCFFSSNDSDVTPKVESSLPNFTACTVRGHGSITSSPARICTASKCEAQLLHLRSRVCFTLFSVLRYNSFPSGCQTDFTLHVRHTTKTAPNSFEMGPFGFLINAGSEVILETKLNRSRSNLGACDRAEVVRAKGRGRIAEHRSVRHVIGFKPELGPLSFLGAPAF